MTTPKFKSNPPFFNAFSLFASSSQFPSKLVASDPDSSLTPLPSSPQNTKDPPLNAPFLKLLQKHQLSLQNRNQPPQRSFAEKFSYATFVGTSNALPFFVYGGIGGASAGLLEVISRSYQYKTQTPHLFSWRKTIKNISKVPITTSFYGALGVGFYGYLTKSGITLLNEMNYKSLEERKAIVGISTGSILSAIFYKSLPFPNQIKIPLLAVIPLTSAGLTMYSF